MGVSGTGASGTGISETGGSTGTMGGAVTDEGEEVKEEGMAEGGGVETSGMDGGAWAVREGLLSPQCSHTQTEMGIPVVVSTLSVTICLQLLQTKAIVLIL